MALQSDSSYPSRAQNILSLTEENEDMNVGLPFFNYDDDRLEPTLISSPCQINNGKALPASVVPSVNSPSSDRAAFLGIRPSTDKIEKHPSVPITYSDPYANDGMTQSKQPSSPARALRPLQNFPSSILEEPWKSSFPGSSSSSRKPDLLPAKRESLKRSNWEISGSPKSTTKRQRLDSYSCQPDPLTSEGVQEPQEIRKDTKHNKAEPDPLAEFADFVDFY
ncbi:MAG: hypothetical protein M1829_005645 [Trizodia sp. TS-e1964]|nr:MAG: hypothetical protein M1829_005645 [Trizodia sp. TS-e1964]